MTTDYGDVQVMMTLAALAATDTTPLPGGTETPGEQQQRMLTSINQQLGDASLATAGTWNGIWVGLSADRANMAFIAQNSAANQYAVSVRGTVPSDVNNWAEDLDVGVILPLPIEGATPLMVSQGAFQAFVAVTSAVFLPGTAPPPALANTTLVEALAELLGAGPSDATVYVTGHSLGGATATTVALYLAGLSWSPNPPTFQVITYAAPTAGLAEFASAFSVAFPNSVRVYNAFDVVPNAWQTLGNLDGYFPAPGGPAADTTYIPGIVAGFLDGIAGLDYTQPSPNPYPINLPVNGSYLFDSCDIGGSGGPTGKLDNTEAYTGQVGFQHSSATYLMLLGAPTPELAPAQVMAVSPQMLPAVGGTPVTINGAGFTGASAVCFGSAVVTTSDFTVDSDNQITVTAPPGAGTVHVTVITVIGASATSANDEAVYPPAVTDVSPGSGLITGGTPVMLSGSGLTGATSVEFGGTPVSGQFTVVADNQISATAPTVTTAGPVEITVTTPAGPSAGSGPTFTYLAAATTAPAVTGIFPASGPTTGGTPVTISGSGFTGATGVSFGTTPVVPGGFLVISDSEVIATAPAGAAGSPDVTVTNSAGTSPTTAADQFTYVAPASPAVASFYPTTGPHAGGIPVSIFGSGLAGATSVEFGTAPACFAVQEDDRIVATPAGVGIGRKPVTVPIVVATPGGTVTTTAEFTFEVGSS